MQRNGSMIVAGVTGHREGWMLYYTVNVPCERQDRPCDPDRDRHRHLCDPCKQKSARYFRARSWNEMLTDQGGQPVSTRQKSQLAGLAGLN